MSGPTSGSTDPAPDATSYTEPYNWQIFSAGTWGLYSYEHSNLVKKEYDNIPNGRWEFESFTHDRLAAFGASIGGTRSYEDISSSINISPSRTSVGVRIDFSVTSSVGGVCPSVTIPYNANHIFNAPNKIKIIH